MANITRFSPLSELSEFDRLAGDFFKGLALRPALRSLAGEPQIRLDVEEDDKAYTVRAEVPGARKEDIKVSVEGNQVSISAEVRNESEEKKGNKIIRSERYYGSVTRGFTLDQKIDDAAASAKYDNGVLLLTLPKATGGGAKQLTVG